MPVMYISRKLNAAETRYSTIERECLALFWATKCLHVYLYGTEFILEIDHQPLAFVNRDNINNDPSHAMGTAFTNVLLSSSHSERQC